MEKLSLKLEHCYGIKKLTHTFDFSKKKTIALYSPNGVMKTSLSKTFMDISNDDAPRDLVYKKNKPVFEINDDSTKVQIEKENIFVIEPYNDGRFGSEDRMVTLLVNKELRDEYQGIYSELESNKAEFVKQLKNVSRSSDCEKEMFATFSDVSSDNFFEILKSAQTEVSQSEEEYNFKYNDVFDSKVKDFLKLHSDLLEDYVNKYGEIIAQNSFFKKTEKGTFGTSQAKDVISSIKDDTFFSAGHSIVIDQRGKVSSSDELTRIVDEEIDKIVSKPELKAVFIKIDTALAKNQKLSDFKKILEEDNTLIAKLSDYELFKKEAWFSYLKKVESEMLALVDLYDSKKLELERISKQAQSEVTEWDHVVNDFNKRFINLPFKLVMSNKHDVILDSKTPAVGFKFEDEPMERGDLLEVLSQGERRAFYLLDIIFEIRSRQKRGQKTLFIIDDIADSFDYKNKYAIVEYLSDISKEDFFYQVILTHNFDFYRTISSRLDICRENKFHAIKTKDSVIITKEVYQNNPFVTWKNNLSHNNDYSVEDAKKHIVALIPFVRNLIEYGNDKEVNGYTIQKDFLLLTELLHIKSDTKNITLLSLQEIYREYLGKDNFDAAINLSDTVYQTIIDLATSVQDDEYNLENKIILAIIIRLIAEEFMFSKVSDKAQINRSQTGVLFGKYKLQFENDSNEESNIKILESVNIMTPENIHINSFMFEPILDMGIAELKSLYTEVTNLK